MLGRKARHGFMARMTVRKHVDSMRHAMPTLPDPRHDFYDTFNQAGRAMMTCAEREPWWHSWTWAQEVSVPAPIKANQDFIDVSALGTGPLVSLGQLVRADLTDATVDRVVMATPQHIQALKSNNTARPNLLYIATSVSPWKPSGDAAPLERLAIWPSQSADRDDLLLTFQRKWIEVESDDDDYVPDIPDEYERLLDLLARGFAVEKETQRPAFESVQVLDEIDRLVGFDAGKQTEDGVPLHSVRRHASGHAGRWFTRVDKP